MRPRGWWDGIDLGRLVPLLVPSEQLPQAGESVELPWRSRRESIGPHPREVS